MLFIQIRGDTDRRLVCGEILCLDFGIQLWWWEQNTGCSPELGVNLSAQCNYPGKEARWRGLKGGGAASWLKNMLEACKQVRFPGQDWETESPIPWSRCPHWGKEVLEIALLCDCLALKFFFVLSSAPEHGLEVVRKSPNSVRLSRDPAPQVSTAGSLISHSSYKTQDESNTKTPQSPCPYVPSHSTLLTSSDEVPSGAHIARSHCSQHSGKPLDGERQSHTLVFLAIPFLRGNALTATTAWPQGGLGVLKPWFKESLFCLHLPVALIESRHVLTPFALGPTMYCRVHLLNCQWNRGVLRLWHWQQRNTVPTAWPHWFIGFHDNNCVRWRDSQ